MLKGRKSEARVLKAGGDSLVALLLIGTLLLCHGLFGIIHQTDSAPPAQVPGKEVPNEVLTTSVEVHEPGGMEDTGQKGHLEDAGYLATLLVILLGATIGLLLWGIRWRSRGTFEVPGRTLPLFSRRFARRLPLAVLQVFRL